MDTYDPQVTGSKGLVYIGDKILVYRRDTRTSVFPLKLDLPGGGVEAGESPFVAFQRELKEEFDLDIARNQVTYGVRFPLRHVRASIFGYLIVAHLSAETESQIVYSNEGLEYMLMPLEEFLEHPDAVPIFREPIEGYLGSLALQPKKPAD